MSKVKMQFKTFVRFYTVLLVLSFGAEIAYGFPSYIDWLPVVSQVKSLIQVIGGDPEGAKQTQENFSRQMPIVSQARSTVEKAMGNFEEARKTEEQFAFDFLEPTVNKMPVIGHVKGAVHMAVGDTKRGEEILKEATKSGLIAVGGTLGGPGGAMSTSLLTDQLYTAIDSAVAQEYKPYGFEEYSQNIDKKTVGEHVDQWVDLASAGLGHIKKSQQ